MGEKERMRDFREAEGTLLPITSQKVYKLALIEAEKKGMITYHIAVDTNFYSCWAAKEPQVDIL